MFEDHTHYLRFQALGILGSKAHGKRIKTMMQPFVTLTPASGFDEVQDILKAFHKHLALSRAKGGYEGYLPPQLQKPRMRRALVYLHSWVGWDLPLALRVTQKYEGAVMAFNRPSRAHAPQYGRR